MPSIVILDPVLTLGLPTKITAATGMDALAHNLEAYCSPGYHPMADWIALEGMRLINNSLVKAVNKNVRSSPRKIALVLDFIKGKKADVAIKNLESLIKDKFYEE